MKPEGRLCSDPIVITGPLSNAEIAIRSSAGFYLLVPQGYDEKSAQCGLRPSLSRTVQRTWAKLPIGEGRS
jgi:hypothetical protein